ncbi:MAG TPA: TIGR03564 family F420-dependent LLM class oxidoreductase [Acidimicrobiia bacterium]
MAAAELGFDALTVLALVGRETTNVELGTSVIPTYPRHPVALAAQALTVNAATGARLVLGIGLSHRVTVEHTYGLSYDRPARHMREYLEALVPLLHDGTADVDGETISAHAQLHVPGATAPTLLLAALQPRMLALAGGVADGTITWCTGPVTLEHQVVPLLRAAASDARRPEPRVVVALPTIVTDDEAHGRVAAGEQLAGYGDLPVYRAVLDAEGVEGPADVSVVGDEAAVTAHLERLRAVGRSTTSQHWSADSSRLRTTRGTPAARARGEAQRVASCVRRCVRRAGSPSSRESPRPDHPTRRAGTPGVTRGLRGRALHHDDGIDFAGPAPAHEHEDAHEHDPREERDESHERDVEEGVACG